MIFNSALYLLLTVPLDIFTLIIVDITICTGLHTISLRYGIRDNVGLAHFGKVTELFMHPLADYDGIKTEIGKKDTTYTVKTVTYLDMHLEI